MESMPINQVWTTMLNCICMSTALIFNCLYFCLFACRFSFDFISINLRWCKLFLVQTNIVLCMSGLFFFHLFCIPCHNSSRPMVACAVWLIVCVCLQMVVCKTGPYYRSIWAIVLGKSLQYLNSFVHFFINHKMVTYGLVNKQRHSYWNPFGSFETQRKVD